MRLKKFTLLWILTSAAWMSSVAVAAPLTFNLDGVISDSANQPLEAAAVTFRVDIKNAAEDCLLYREDFLVSMTGSKGYFSIVVGKTANLVAGGAALDKVFANHLTTAIAGQSCTYTPASATETRKVIVSFNDGATSQIFTTQEIQAVPFALQAQAVNGYGTGELLKVAPTVSQVSQANSDLNQTQYDEFWRLVNNPLAAYLPVSGDVSLVGGNNKITNLLGQALPAGPATNGQVLVSNGTAWVLQSMSSGSVTSVSGTAPVVVGGTATAPVVSLPAATTSASGYLTSTDWNTFNSKQSSSLASGKILVGNASGLASEVGVSGDATIDNAGVMSLKNTGTAGTYYKVTTDAQGRVTSGANLAASDITTALGYTPLNKAGGTMGGTLNMGGFDITNTGNITMAANQTLGLSSHAVDPVSPASGQVWYNSTSNVVKYYNGTAVQSVGGGAAGLSSLNGLSSGTQSFATGTSGTSPAFSSATSTHTLNIPMASTASVTAGLISKADYDTFNAKLSGVSNSASLTSGKVWIGNASNAATELTLSGDATLANTGVVTVDKTQTAAASKILQLDASSVAVTKGTDIGGASTGKVSLRYPATAANTTLTLPSTAGSPNQFLQTNGSGGLTWADPTALLPGLASTQVWVGNASGSAAAVSLSGDITGITNAGVVTANKTTTAEANKLLSLNGSGVATSMGNQLNGLTSGSLTLQANSVTTNYSLTFPAAQGSVGQTLTNNGAGVLSWASALTNSLASGKILVGNASNVSAEVNFSGDATMDNAGVVTLKSTGTPGTYSKVTTDAQGRVTSGANLASSDITTALGYTPVNKAGDSMSGALAMGGFDIANTGNITMAANMTLGLSNNSTDPASPASGQVWYNSTSNVVKYYDGTSVQSLGVAGAGITSLNGLSSGTQSFAIGTSGNSPAFSSATSTHTLNIPMASTVSVTAGLISKADYDAFNAKLSGVSNSASLTSGKVWIGNASNAATELTLSGDATLANTGVVTVDKTQTAAASKILQLDASSVAVTKGTDIGGASTGKVSLRYPSTATDTTLTLPSTAGSPNQFLQTNGSGNLMWADPTAILPGLASTQVWVGNASGSAAAVSLSGDITGITNAGVVTANKTTSAEANKLLSLDGSGVATTMGNQINGLTSGSLNLQANAVTTNYSLTFPAAQGSAGQTLSNDGAGGLNWVTPLSSSTGFLNGGNTFAGNSSIGNNDNFNLDLKTNGISRMTVLNTGNIGIGTTTPSSTLSFNGNTPKAIGVERSSIGNTAGGGLTIRAGGAASGATDKAGGDLNFYSGLSTGTGASTIKFMTSDLNTSGTTDNTMSETARIGHGAFSLIPANFGTALMFNASIPSLSSSDTYIKSDSAFEIWHNNANDTLVFAYAPPGTGGTTLSFQPGIVMDTTGKIGIGNDTPAALLDVGKAGTTLGTLRLAGNTSGYVQMQPASAAGSWTMTLPPNAGTNGAVLSTNGTGVTSWVPALTNTLTSGRILVGNASNVATEQSLSGDITMTNTGVVTVDKTQTAAANKILQLDASSVAATKGTDIGGAGSGKVSLRYPTTTTNTTLTFPSSVGAVNQFLQTDGSGILTWADPTAILPGLASTQVWVGNASGSASAVSLSGDIASITDLGVVTIAKTTTAQANKLLVLDGSGIATSMGSQLNGLTSGSLTLQADAVTANYSLTFPAAQGGAGQTLSNNGSGTLSWVTPFSSSTGFVNGGNTFAGNSSLGNNDNFNLDLKTNGISRMTILNTGNIGIGTATPSSTLSFNGTSPQAIGVERSSVANTVGSGLTIRAGGAASGATNRAGGDLNLYSGLSTGTGTSTIKFMTPEFGATGTADRAMIESARMGPSAFSLIPSNNGTALMFNGHVPVQNMDYYIKSGSAFEIWHDIFTDTMEIGYAPWGTAGTTIAFQPGIVMDTSGRIGIGTKTPASLLDVGKAGTTLGTLRLAGSASGFVQMQPATAAGSWTMTLPSSPGTNGFVLTTNGTGVTSWQPALTNTLTSGRILVGNASNVAAEQSLSGDITMTNTGVVTVDKTQTAGASKILQLDASSVAVTKGTDIGGAGSGKVALRYPTTPTNTTLTFPSSVGAVNQFLQTDGSGNLTWASPVPTLPALPSTQVWVGNSSGVATAVTLGGDIANVDSFGSVTLNTVPVTKGGTGTTTGSITGTGALSFIAGGTSQDITLTPSTGGRTVASNSLEVNGFDTNTLLNVINTSNTANGALRPTVKVSNFAGTNTGSYPRLLMHNARGSSGSKAALASGDLLGSLEVYGNYDTTANTVKGAAINFKATGSFTPGSPVSYPTSIVFQTANDSASGGALDRMVIAANGNVGIGVAIPGSPLTVSGGTSLAVDIQNSSLAATANFQNNGSGTAAIFTGGSSGVSIGISGHILSSGYTISVSTCGTSPAPIITGNDTRGSVTIGGGSISSCTITFNTPYSTPPYCVATWKGSALTTGIGVSATTTFLTVNFSGPLAASNAFNYFCMQ